MSLIDCPSRLRLDHQLNEEASIEGNRHWHHLYTRARRESGRTSSNAGMTMSRRTASHPLRLTTLLFLVVSVLVVAASMSSAIPLPQEVESPHVRRSLEQSASAATILKRIPAVQATTEHQRQRRDLPAAVAAGASPLSLRKRSPSARSSSFTRRSMPFVAAQQVVSRHRIMPFPALDEPLRRKGGLMGMPASGPL